MTPEIEMLAKLTILESIMSFLRGGRGRMTPSKCIGKPLYILNQRRQVSAEINGYAMS